MALRPVVCPYLGREFSIQENALRYAWKLSTGVSGLFKRRLHYHGLHTMNRRDQETACTCQK
jgi:hypothetical protein